MGNLNTLKSSATFTKTPNSSPMPNKPTKSTHGGPGRNQGRKKDCPKKNLRKRVPAKFYNDLLAYLNKELERRVKEG